MTTFEILLSITTSLLVPWNAFLTVYAIISVRDRAALATRLEERKGVSCALHSDVMVRIDNKLETLANAMAEMNGFLRGRDEGHQEIHGAKRAEGGNE